MKISYTSDLHLEFHKTLPLELLNPENADVLVLAGDCMLARDLYTWPENRAQENQSPGFQAAQLYRELLQQASDHYKHVVFVAGNHEFYHFKFQKTLQVLEQECKRFKNVYFLERGTLQVEDTTFLGATLWTDCNNHDPLTLYTLQYSMNDYRTVVNDTQGYTSLRPQHTLARHVQTKQWLQKALRLTQKAVVVSHHAPSFLSVPDDYKADRELNGGYASNLEEFILDHEQIRLWIHGHMHHHQDYHVGETRVVCNPRGYPNQNPLWQLKTLEL